MMKKDTTPKHRAAQQRHHDNLQGEPLNGLIDGISGNYNSSSTGPVAHVVQQTAADLAKLYTNFGAVKAPPPHKWSEAPGTETSNEAVLATSPRFVIFAGRSQVGKSFACEFVAEHAIAAGMKIALADFDRDNASMTARFGLDRVMRPDNAEDVFFEEGLKKLFAFQKQYKCDVMIDIGFASVRTFCAVARKIHLQAIQEANGIRPVLVVPVGLNLDDLMVLEKFDGAYLPRDILLMLNEFLVPAGQDASLAFGPVLRDPRIHGLIKRGARQMMMPALPGGAAFHNTKRPFEWAARMDWDSPLNEFQQAGAAHFLREMRAACRKHVDILPFSQGEG